MRLAPAELAAARRRNELTVPLVLVTGTVGKSTVCQMLVHLTGAFTNPGNLNRNRMIYRRMERMPADARLAVFESGWGCRKDSLRSISFVLRPDIAVLTQVDVAHVDNLGGVSDFAAAYAGVVEQKLQIAEGRSGTFIVHDSVPLMDVTGRVVTFGWEGDARLLDVQSDGGGSFISADVLGTRVAYRLQAPGEGAAMNSLAALCVVRELGIDVSKASARMESWQPLAGRARVLTLPNGATLIDDAFNATPLSVRSTLRLLRDMPAQRRIAVLGDIAHLGVLSAELHRGLAADAEDAADVVFTFGRDMRHLHDAVTRKEARHFESRDELTATLLAMLRAGDAVTVKASIPAGFQSVVMALREA
jgi:UDP-N-acetylmuramoyl-tripeptide--D-alanyl-D-alanine ligase